MTPNPHQDLTARRIAAFWAPLAATWIMMSVEGPFLAAVVARLPAPKENLAAFGVAFSLALVFEAPVIMLMAAVTALARDGVSTERLRRFSYALSVGVTVVMAVAVVPPVFRVLAGPVLGLPEGVARLTHPALVLLLPWPGVIGYRRFLQGVLIRTGRTRRVGTGTAVRLAGMAATALVLAPTGLAGALVGAAALCAGVVAEAAAVRAMTGSSLRELRATAEQAPAPSYRQIARFYAPLALSTLLTLAVHPTVTFFLARAREPVGSLAVFPVVRSLVFLFSCLGLSFQEVAIALMGERWEGYRPLRRFALGLALATSAGLGLVALTPLGRVWFQDVSGLRPDLVALAILPAALLVPVPALTVMLSFLRAAFVHAGRTGPITGSTAVEVTAIAAALAVGIAGFDWVGVVAGAAALDVGRVTSALVLAWAARRLWTARDHAAILTEKLP
ncbi:hypothetical protein [Deferrisoma camini]|uniref:hypothetical protein n=1 Tax=Deferrisoma camini TaxID=1035120 RepID=UPI00046C9D87|nr:hypothetical protein [Deferrisoma camini]